MAEKHDFGRKGEDFACKYLLKKGYSILERNWRFSKAEIDIIAKKEDVLVFVEVKAKSYTFYGRPEESVDGRKQALMIDAANQYMQSVGHDWEIRFDIISLVGTKDDGFELKHFEDAFF